MENTTENVQVQYIEKPSKVVGILALVFSILSIVLFGIIFVPLGFIFSIWALVKKQWIYGVLGILFSIVGFATSPMLIGLILSLLGV